MITVVVALAAGCGGRELDSASAASRLCASQATAGAPLRVRVMTINVRHDEDQWERRFELIADEIARLDPDFIGAQEIELGARQSAALNDRLLRRGHAAYEVHEAPKDAAAWPSPGEGEAIFSRWPIVARDVALLPHARVAVLARVQHPTGAIFDVVTSHFSPGHGDSNATARLAQAKTTIALADGHIPARAGWGPGGCIPTFLVGDFNAYDTEPPLRAMAAAGFVDSYRVVHGDAVEPGGLTDPVVLADGAFVQSPRDRVDFVLGRGEGLAPIASEVCFRNHDARGFYPSDHFGVVTTYEMHGAGALPHLRRGEPGAAAAR